MGKELDLEFEANFMSKNIDETQINITDVPEVEEEKSVPKLNFNLIVP